MDDFQKISLKILIVSSVFSLVSCQILNITEVLDNNSTLLTPPDKNQTSTDSHSRAELQRLGLLISSTFVNCSAKCSFIPDCLGITIYKKSDRSSNNSDGNNSREEGGIPTSSSHFNDSDTVFWCRMDLEDSPEDLAQGNIVYKVMFRDKLKKVWRLPLLYRNTPAKSRQQRKRSSRQTDDREHVFDQNQHLTNTVVDIHLQPQEQDLDDVDVFRRNEDERLALLTKGLPNPQLAQGTIQKNGPAFVEIGTPQKTVQVTVPSMQAIANATQGTNLFNIPNTVVSGPPQKTLVITIPNSLVNSTSNLNATFPSQTQTKTGNASELESTTEKLSPVTTIIPADSENSSTTTTTVATRLIENTTTPRTVEITTLASAPMDIDERLGLTKPSAIPVESAIRVGTDEIIFPGETNRKTPTTTETTVSPTVPAVEETEKGNGTFDSVSVNISQSSTENPGQVLSSTTSEDTIISISESLGSTITPEPEPESSTNKIKMNILVSPSVVPESIEITTGKKPEIKVGFQDLSQEKIENVPGGPGNKIQSAEELNTEVEKAENLLNSTFSSVTALLKTLAKASLCNKNQSQIQLDRIRGGEAASPVNGSAGILSEKSKPKISISNSVEEPSASDQLEGEHVDTLAPTEIPPPMLNESLEVTVAPFPILRPTSSKQPLVHVEDNNNLDTNHHGINTEITPGMPGLSQLSDKECLLTDDKERFKRDILSTTFSMMDDEPTMLSFVNGSSCVGTFSKRGIKTVRNIRKFLPEFPAEETQIVAGAYYNKTVYLFDSDEEQTVWNFFYDPNFRSYREEPQERMTNDFFMEHFCRIPGPAHFKIKAVAQFSLTDNSCILFDKSGNVLVSPDASLEATQLTEAILSVVEKEFLHYVESVFAWLDEAFVSRVYVFGSNKEVYEVFRDETTNFTWTKGAYRVIPYEDFPYR